ncbi:MAG: glycosyltransferase family 39 protein [Planctomycetota bacterium]
MRRAERAVVVGIVALTALGLRAWFVATSTVDNPLRADAGQYAQYAHNLLAHGTFSLDTAAPPRPDSFRSPGYPAFVAGLRALAGDGWLTAVRQAQAVLGALLVPMTFWLARRRLPFAAALAASALVAVSPHLVAASGYLLTEALFATVLLLACCLLARAVDRPTAGAAGAAGLALGTAALVNEALSPLALLLPLLLRRPLGGRGALVLFAAAALPLGAWSVRNHSQDLARTGGERVLASLSHGSYPGMLFASERYRYFPYAEDPEQPEFGASWPRFREVFAARVAERPARHLWWYCAEKPAWLWGWDIVQGAGPVYVYPVRHSILDEQPVVRTLAGVARWLHWPMVAACLFGIVLALRRGAASAADQRARSAWLRPMVVLLLWFTAVYTMFVPDPRYLVPLRPLQAVVAAAAVTALWQRWSRRKGEGRSESKGEGDRDGEGDGDARGTPGAPVLPQLVEA